MDPLSGQLWTGDLWAVDADPPIAETQSSLDKVRQAVVRLNDGMAVGFCNLSVKLLRVEEATTHGLLAVLTAVLHFGTIPPD